MLQQGYRALVLADSIANDVRLTTLEVTFPRFILAELNTHRMLSRNSASSRAIPVPQRIEQVRANPFVPEAFRLNQRGMQGGDLIDEDARHTAKCAWFEARDAAIAAAEKLVARNVHKQHANRLLEPFCWHTAVITATDWSNFFALRDHPAAQPEMQMIARGMREAMDASTPRSRDIGEWHLPYIEVADWELVVPELGVDEAFAQLVKMSVVRCAAVSYERQHASRTQEQYAVRHAEMAAAGHWSPFEHQAVVLPHTGARRNHYHGNFRFPWLQHRKQFGGEAVFGLKRLHLR